MKTKIYAKPTFTEVSIQMNDLCVGSQTTKINVRVWDKKKSNKVYKGYQKVRQTALGIQTSNR